MWVDRWLWWLWYEWWRLQDEWERLETLSSLTRDRPIPSLNLRGRHGMAQCGRDSRSINPNQNIANTRRSATGPLFEGAKYLHSEIDQLIHLSLNNSSNSAQHLNLEWSPLRENTLHKSFFRQQYELWQYNETKFTAELKAWQPHCVQLTSSKPMIDQFVSHFCLITTQAALFYWRTEIALAVIVQSPWLGSPMPYSFYFILHPTVGNDHKPVDPA